jgi:hypothetical protein
LRRTLQQKEKHHQEKLNKEQGVQECDATTAQYLFFCWLQKKSCLLTVVNNKITAVI